MTKIKNNKEDWQKKVKRMMDFCEVVLASVSTLNEETPIVTYAGIRYYLLHIGEDSKCISPDIQGAYPEIN